MIKKIAIAVNQHNKIKTKLIMVWWTKRMIVWEQSKN
jgi:hypothetical protein